MFVKKFAVTAVAAGLLLSAGTVWAQAPNIEMVFVEGGTFTMGCTPEQGADCFPDERPAHRVTVDGFHIGKYEVTQAQWNAVMGSVSKNPEVKGNNLPATDIDWDDTQEFIKKLNEMTGKKYRLPTEAEWEYAARGGSKSKRYKYSGSNDINAVAWHEGNSNGQPHPVGRKLANELGIHDMSGNVAEWVNDYFGRYSSAPKTNPTGRPSADPSTTAKGGTGRVLRDGGYLYDARSNRVSKRVYDDGHGESSVYGFRLAMSALSAEEQAAIERAAQEAKERAEQEAAERAAREEEERAAERERLERERTEREAREAIVRAERAEREAIERAAQKERLERERLEREAREVEREEFERKRKNRSRLWQAAFAVTAIIVIIILN